MVFKKNLCYLNILLTIISSNITFCAQQIALIDTNNDIERALSNFKKHNAYQYLSLKDSLQTFENAYQNLLAQHHPDKGGNTENFKNLQKSYELLKNFKDKELKEKDEKLKLGKELQRNAEDQSPNKTKTTQQIIYERLPEVQRINEYSESIENEEQRIFETQTEIKNFLNFFEFIEAANNFSFKKLSTKKCTLPTKQQINDQYKTIITAKPVNPTNITDLKQKKELAMRYMTIFDRYKSLFPD